MIPAAEATSPWPVATCLVGGGGGVALYKWSFGHQQELLGLFWVKNLQLLACAVRLVRVPSMHSFYYISDIERNRALFPCLFRHMKFN